MHLIKSWDNKKIRIRKDRYVSLTDMAQATGKQVNDFVRLKQTQSYLDALSRKTGIPVMTEQQGVQTLLEIKKGGDVASSGTWGHPKLAIAFARWCNDDLAVQMDFWIDELLTTGNVSLAPKSEAPVFRLYSERRDKNAVLNLPENYWCVFRESMNFLIDFEKAVNRLGIEIAVSQYDLLDGSIGSCWSKYRKDKEWAKPTKTYRHHFRDKRGEQEANCYHRDELWEFRTWLDKIYSPNKMPDYLKRKYGAGHDLVLRSGDIVGLLPAMM